MNAPEPSRDVLRDVLGHLGPLQANPPAEAIAKAKLAAASLVSLAIGPADHRSPGLMQSLLEDLFAAGPAWGHGALAALTVRCLDAFAIQVGETSPDVRPALWAHVLRVTAQPDDPQEDQS